MQYLATVASDFVWFWAAWIFIFFVIEFAAIWIGRRNEEEHPHDGGTLSELVWRVTRSNKIVQILFIIFWAWLTFHFFVEG